MPWKECNHMDERLRFVARLLDGEKMAVMCREFGISRKTGYKIFNRYKEYGLRGLEDRSSGSVFVCRVGQQVRFTNDLDGTTVQLCPGAESTRLPSIDVRVLARECCGGQVRIIASIEDPAVIARILEHLDQRQPSAVTPTPRSRAPPHTHRLD